MQLCEGNSFLLHSMKLNVLYPLFQITYAFTDHIMI